MFEYVCFNITSKCNMNCPFCYRVGELTGSVTFIDAKKYIDILCDLGCKTISITGGEPLLNPCWKRIIGYCKIKGLTTILSTNGLLLDLDDSILNKINVLSIPLDDSNRLKNDTIRARGHYKKIIDIIQKYIEGNYSFTLKINTVVTPDNYDSLGSLLTIVDNERIIWKLFELREKGNYYTYKKRFLDKENLFNKIIDLQNTSHQCSIYYMSNEKLLNSFVSPNYLILDFNGDIYLATYDKNIKICNILEEINLNIVYNNLNNQYCEEFKNDF